MLEREYKERAIKELEGKKERERNLKKIKQ